MPLATFTKTIHLELSVYEAEYLKNLTQNKIRYTDATTPKDSEVNENYRQGIFKALQQVLNK